MGFVPLNAVTLGRNTPPRYMVVFDVPHWGITIHHINADLRGAGMAQTTEYKVTGMSCGHCEASVRGEVSKLAGIERIDVSAATGRLIVESTASLTDADVIAAVDEAGYEAVRV